MTIQQRRTARLQMEEQRALAARLLAEMDEPFELSDRAKAAIARTAEGQRIADALDERAGHYHKPKRTYVAVEALAIDADPETGCRIWDGKFRTDHHGVSYPSETRVHERCGKTHFSAVRGLYEEVNNVILDELTDMVVGTCPTNVGSDVKACVEVTHHIVKERA